MKKNEGEVPQYYVQNSHPAIIDPDEFDAVQVEIQRRKNLGRPSACQSPMSMKLVCAGCGGYFGSKVWNSTNKYRREVWQCNNKYKEAEKCTTPHVVEDVVKQKFVEAFNSLKDLSEELIANCRMVQLQLCDCTGLDAQLNELYEELVVIQELARKAIYENAHGSLKSEEWEQRNTGYQDRHLKTINRLTELENNKNEKLHKNIVLAAFIKNLEETGTTIDEFNERLWMMTVERVVVEQDGGLTFEFKDGIQIKK